MNPGSEDSVAGADDSVRPSFETILRSDGVTFDRADAALLRAIDDHGSVSDAAAALGRSRSVATRRLSDLEGAFGPLVATERGGSGGGGSHVTGWGRQVLGRFERLQTEFSGVVAVDETVLEGRVLDSDGDLATVETAAGRLRALAPQDADAVWVALRADVVTVHDPEGAPEAGVTSARNRLPGTVVGTINHGSTVELEIDVGAAEPFTALVTAESADELDAGPGRAVVVSFKTTATRATPRW
jgi:molybdate transport system regulatory protein